MTGTRLDLECIRLAVSAGVLLWCEQWEEYDDFVIRDGYDIVWILAALPLGPCAK